VHNVSTKALLPDPGFNYDEVIKTDFCNIQYMTLGEAIIKYVRMERKEKHLT
jgi:hypothetical protein